MANRILLIKPRVEAVIEGFKSADGYIFSLPRWNFGIPYVLSDYGEGERTRGFDGQVLVVSGSPNQTILDG